MANLNTPQGLSPIRRLDGAKWGDSLRVYYVPAANTHALYVGDPVVKIAASANARGINGVDLATAGDNGGTPPVGDPITGVVCGFVGVTPAGSTQEPSFFGLSAKPGPVYRPAATDQDYYVLVNDDPEAEFLVQVTSTNVLTAADIGKNANLVAGAGSPYTGWSGWTVSDTTSADVLQVNIVGVSQETNNDMALPYAKAIVRLNTSTETNRSAGI
jgi:hypothetical protein